MDLVNHTLHSRTDNKQPKSSDAKTFRTKKQPETCLRRFLAFLKVFPFPLLAFQHISASVGEITQWPTLIALFSQRVPPSCVCYCRTGGYAGQGSGMVLRLHNLIIFSLIIGDPGQFVCWTKFR